MAYTYEARIHIDAPPERVWAVLTNLDDYPGWNPFTPEVDSSLEVGQAIWLWVDLGWIRLWQREVVRAVEAPERLVWDFGLPYVLWAERVQTLSPAGAGTDYRTVDRIGGALGPLVHLLFGGALDRGFTAMSEALRARATRQAPT